MSRHGILVWTLTLWAVLPGCGGGKGERRPGREPFTGAAPRLREAATPPRLHAMAAPAPHAASPDASIRAHGPRGQGQGVVVHSLALRGFAPSSYVVPSADSQGPLPVLVLLHGSYDSRASQCRAWGRVGSRWGWLLCPAGLHRTDVPSTEDRWTWGKVAHMIREIRMGLSGLQKLYPGRVDTGRLTLVGFSLGALLLHEVAYFSRGMFPRLIAVEGVARLRRRWSRRLHRRGVRKMAYLCGELTHCTSQVGRRMEYLRAAGISVRAFVIPGAGHGYGDRFDPVAERVLSWLMAPRARGRSAATEQEP